MADFLHFVVMYVPQVIMLLFAIFISYKAIWLYGNTKNTVALLISITFLLAAANRLLAIITTNINIKLLINSEKMSKAKIGTYIGNYMREFEDLVGNSFIIKYGLTSVLGFLVFLAMMFIFYKKLKTINYPAIYPRIILFLCSFCIPLFFIKRIIDIKSGSFISDSLLPVPSPGTTLFLLLIGIVSLGLLAYRKSKDMVYFYLCKSFIILSLGVSILTLLIIFVGEEVFPRILNFHIPKTSQFLVLFWVVLPLYLYGYYLTLKALKTLKEQS